MGKIACRTELLFKHTIVVSTTSSLSQVKVAVNQCAFSLFREFKFPVVRFNVISTRKCGLSADDLHQIENDDGSTNQVRAVASTNLLIVTFGANFSFTVN